MCAKMHLEYSSFHDQKLNYAIFDLQFGKVGLVDRVYQSAITSVQVFKV